MVAQNALIFEPGAARAKPLSGGSPLQEFIACFASPIYGVTAGQMMPLWSQLSDALGQVPTHRMIVAASEDTAGFAVLGAALIDRHFGSGRPGLLITSSAQVGCKVIPALWCANTKRWPLVLVTGDAATDAPCGSVQDGRGKFGPSLTRMTRELTVLSLDLFDPESARHELSHAAELASHAQRPVHLNLCVDVQARIWRLP